jgi:chromosome segregation ATPase
LIDEEAELDRLYSLSPEEFIAARNELAKRFRDEGQRAIATRIKELKKPTVSAWVVNELARLRELDVERLLRAGERLRKAQLQAVAHKDAGEFVEARRDEQAALNRLTQAAREILQSADRSTGVVDRVAATLRAAATKEDGREILKRGRLAEDLEPQGFESLASLGAARTLKSTRAKSATTRSRAADEIAAKRHALAEARKRAHQLDRELRERRRHLEGAERDVEEARHELEDAEARVTEARRAVVEAEQAAEQAKEHVRGLS